MKDDLNLSLLLTELIKSQKETNESIKGTNKTVDHLAKSVDSLITDSKVREEKDKSLLALQHLKEESQAKENDKFSAFIESSRPTINRQKNFNSIFDKAKAPLIAAAIIGIATAFKFTQ
ncbi:MAG: hypothetical protein GY822_25430, partial [Deltaproteobacteria bacterium]|nr:hypothetical protein [Deltaproteobacteria bacterium]